MRTSRNAYEELLVLRAQNGDQRAMCALVDHWNRPLSRHARHLTGDSDGANETMQEAWLAIVRSIRKLEDPAAFRSWAYRIVANKCADWIRRRSRSRAVDQPLAADTLEAAASEEDRSDDISTLQKALARLPAEQRAVLSMFYLDEMSIRDIALVFSVPAGTIKSRLFHARNRLKQIIKE